MTHDQTRPAGSVPTFEPGLTLLETPDPRASAIHQLALGTIRRTDGPTYWLDARNTASTYALYDLVPDPRLLRGVRIARAFTAYQHHALAERVVNTVSPRTGCVVVPNAASLYRDDDVPAHESKPLCDAVVGALREVATTFEIPVLVTDAGPNDDLAGVLADHADRALRCERTRMGYRYEGEDFETTVYWQDGDWQTTIPYWVALLGAVGESAPGAMTGTELAFALEG
jgi:hypothetical protein